MPPKKIAPYLVFAGDMRDKCRAELVAAGNPKPAMGDIAKRVGEKWKELDEETKQVRAPCPTRVRAVPFKSSTSPRASSREWKRSSHPSPSISPQAYKDRAEATNAEAARANTPRRWRLARLTRRRRRTATPRQTPPSPRSRQAHHEAR